MPQQHLFSMPKASAPNPKHRKVTVTTKADGSPLYNLEEVLLSCGVEPNEVVSAFGNLDSASYFMKLERTWDTIKAMHDLFPGMYDDLDFPEAKLFHALLVRNLRPLSLCNPGDVRFVEHLNELQDGWDGIKETHAPVAPVCAFCGVAGAVLRCSGCMELRKEVRYCNKECQIAGWKAHKKAGCGRYASEEMKARVKQACKRVQSGV
jgi:hypothetical protein